MRLFRHFGEKFFRSQFALGPFRGGAVSVEAVSEWGRFEQLPYKYTQYRPITSSYATYLLSWIMASLCQLLWTSDIVSSLVCLVTTAGQLSESVKLIKSFREKRQKFEAQ